MKILYIHGANCTSASWNYIRKHVNHSHELVDYSCSRSFFDNLDQMIELTEGTDSWVLAGHSLGGIYALHLSQALGARCLGGVSISTPFGGTSLADFGKLMFPTYQLFKDVGTFSRPILASSNIAKSLTIPWTQIVTTIGNVPYILGKNDGVCTEASMRKHATSMEIVEVACTHYEVLQNDLTVEVINQTLDRCHHDT